MPLATPTLLSPFDASYSTNTSPQVISGEFAVGVNQVYINDSPADVAIDLPNRKWSYRTPTLVEGNNVFRIRAYNGIEFSPELVLSINYTSGVNQNFAPVPPSGFYTRSYVNAIELVIEVPKTVTLLPGAPVGFNFYYATESGLDFERLNTTPIRTVSNVLRKEIETAEEFLPITDQAIFEGTPGNFEVERKVTTTTYQDTYQYIYKHTPSSLVPLDATVPAFYYATAIYIDDLDKVEVESLPSLEVATHVVGVDLDIRGLPERTREDMIADYIDFLYDTDSRLDTAPGTATRDFYIEPFAYEVEKLRFLVDFYSRCQSFVALVDLDDNDRDEISDPVSSSAYKTRLKVALGVREDFEVQRVIDEAFDRLAGNLGVSRSQPTFAKGLVKVSVQQVTSDIVVQQGAVFSSLSDPFAGTTPVYFSADFGASITLESSPSFYNSETGFFEMFVSVTALEPGPNSNVPAGFIERAVSGVIGGPVLVSNDNPTRSGQGQESNYTLAQRCYFALVGVDSGTAGGYTFDSMAISGVDYVQVVSSGDDLMVRDIITVPTITNGTIQNVDTHVWGTVDLYVQGSSTAIATDTVAYISPQREDELFKVEDSVMFQFRATNPAITQATPISEVFRVYNATRQESYDLTGLTIIGGAFINLDENSTINQDIGLCDTDVIRVDYAYRQIGNLYFTNQPMIDIISIEGEVSGNLSNNYNLVRNSHPLYEGRSNQAGDYLEIFYNEENDKPSGDFISSVDSVTLLEEYTTTLTKFGIVIDSVTVRSSNNAILYTAGVDYNLVMPTSEFPKLRISRIRTGSIPNAASVNVAYQHGENITVRYSYYATPSLVDNTLSDKHIDADVLVKMGLENKVDVGAIVVMRRQAIEAQVDLLIKSRINTFFSRLRMGESVHPSDIYSVIDSTPGVDFVIQPLTKLYRQADNYIIDEQLPTTSWNQYGLDVVRSYITANPVLRFTVAELGGKYREIQGGPGYEKRIVGVRDGATFYEQVDSESLVTKGPSRCFIRTDGKIVVSTKDGLPPTNRIVYATYFTAEGTGSQSVYASKSELLLPGEINIRLIPFESRFNV